MSTRRQSLRGLPRQDYTEYFRNDENSHDEEDHNDRRPSQRRRTDPRRVSESPLANNVHDNEDAVDQQAVQLPSVQQPAAVLNEQPPPNVNQPANQPVQAADVGGNAENNNDIVIDNVNYVATYQPDTTAIITNKISNVPVQEENGKTFIWIFGDRYVKAPSGSNNESGSSTFIHPHHGRFNGCKFWAIRQDNIDLEFSRDTGIANGDVFIFPHSKTSLHHPSCQYYNAEQDVDQCTSIRLPDHLVFPRKYHNNGDLNKDVAALEVNPSVLSAVRFNAGKNIAAGGVDSLVLSDDVVSQAGNFLKAYELGLLPGVRDRTIPMENFLSKYLNKGHINMRKFNARVLAPHRVWDYGPYYGRVVSDHEPETYHDQIQHRVVVCQMIETEIWMKRLHNMGVIGGYLEQHEEVAIDESNYQDDYYEEAEEVDELLTTIDDIPDDEVDENRNISLVDVATVGMNVQRTLDRTPLLRVENELCQAVLILSYKDMLPPLPDDADIDYDAIYFGRHARRVLRHQFDAIRLLEMATGRTNVAMRKSLTLRGMKVRTREIIQRNVDEDKSIRILIYLRSLVRRIRSEVEEENNADADVEEVNEE